MTAQEMRVAVAEWAGRKTGWWCPNCETWVDPKYVTFDEHHDDPDCDCLLEISPDYPNDLNAMHLADPTGVAALKLCEMLGVDKYTRAEAIAQAIMSATPAQWLEALVRTIGKWKD